VRRHGRSRAFAANQSSNAATSFEFLVFSFEFKKLLTAKYTKYAKRKWKNPVPMRA